MKALVKKLDESGTSSRLLGHGIGGRYPLGGGTMQLNLFPSSGQCLSNLSPLSSVFSSFRIASLLSKHGISSLMPRGHMANFSMTNLESDEAESSARMTKAPSLESWSAAESNSPTSKSSDMVPLSLRIPKRLIASS